MQPTERDPRAERDDLPGMPLSDPETPGNDETGALAGMTGAYVAPRAAEDDGRDDGDEPVEIEPLDDPGAGYEAGNLLPPGATGTPPIR